MPHHIDADEVPYAEELVQLAQIKEYGGCKFTLFYWHQEQGRVYIQECFKDSRFWHSQQDDIARESLENLGLLGNVTIHDAVIMDGQTGGHPAPPDFTTKKWSHYAALREALSFEIKKDPLPEAQVQAQESIVEMEMPSLEYIAASELFGY